MLEMSSDSGLNTGAGEVSIKVTSPVWFVIDSGIV